MNRLTKLNELKNFITENKLNLDSLLKEFNWTIEDVMKEFNKNSSNQITTKNEEEPMFPESIEWNNSCLIDNQTLQNILVEKEHDDNNSLKISHTTTTTTTTVPNKFSDLQVNFTREQKLKIYEHVINNTKKLSEPELAISMKSEDSEENKMMTFAEIVAIKRNLKRRRQKYRTTKLPPLSQTEEIRNLIDLQMQAFIQYQNEKFPSMKENKGADDSSSNSNKVERKMKRERDDVSFEMKQLEAHCSSSSAVIETAIKDRNYYKRKSSRNISNDGSRSSSTSSSISTRSRRSRSRSRSKSKKYHRKSDKEQKNKSKKKLKKKKSKKHKNRDHHQRHHHHHRRDEDYNTKKKSQ